MRVIDVPQTADIVVLFKADEGDAVFVQLTGCAQAHGAGTDDGVHGKPRSLFLLF
jgi:hypothetical protein